MQTFALEGHSSKDITAVLQPDSPVRKESRRYDVFVTVSADMAALVVCWHCRRHLGCTLTTPPSTTELPRRHQSAAARADPQCCTWTRCRQQPQSMPPPLYRCHPMRGRCHDHLLRGTLSPAGLSWLPSTALTKCSAPCRQTAATLEVSLTCVTAVSRH